MVRGFHLVPRPDGHLLHPHPRLLRDHDAHQTAPGTGKRVPSIQDLAKLTGNLARGQKLFHERAACATCHAFGGKGGAIGPDLSTIGSKFDASAILDALINPSASITFGYEATVVTLKNGEAVTGFVVGAGDPLLLADIAPRQQRAIPASEIASTERLKTSLMPPVTSLGLKDQDLADLVEFLMTAPSAPATK